MRLIFHPAAELEFTEAAIYYQENSPGLGAEFIEEIKYSLDLIRRNPDIFPTIDRGVRRILIRRFPFAILFRRSEDSVFILAIMHLHRNPEYWKRRI
jgi:plasmid stabilization system protein ParE